MSHHGICRYHWDPYFKKDIKRLERVQHQAACFIAKDYSRETGCVTKMLGTHEIPSLLNRRKEALLALMYKVVHDLIPALHQLDFLEPAKQRRKIKTPSHLKDYVADTTVTDKTHNHSKCYVVLSSKTDQYKHSFSVETVLDSEFGPHEHL